MFGPQSNLVVTTLPFIETPGLGGSAFPGISEMPSYGTSLGSPPNPFYTTAPFVEAFGFGPDVKAYRYCGDPPSNAIDPKVDQLPPPPPEPPSVSPEDNPTTPFPNNGITPSIPGLPRDLGSYPDQYDPFGGVPFRREKGSGVIYVAPVPEKTPEPFSFRESISVAFNMHRRGR